MENIELKILLSKKMGFCFGVKKSVDLAKKATETSNGKVYMLGPIINNPQVLEYFLKKGVKVVDSLNKIPEKSTVITRAHGISPSVLNQSLKKKLSIIDTTCPYVKKVQKIAVYLNKNGYCLVIFGDKIHSEIVSLLDVVNNNAIVIDSFSEIEKISKRKKIGFISQTTKNIYNFQKLSSALLDKTEELRIFNTICKATTERQKSVLKLAMQVDIMVVIGGSKSANTFRLAEICKNQGVKTYHIETKDQMKYEWIRPEAKVGIASGASTPDWVINEVITRLKEWYA